MTKEIYPCLWLDGKAKEAAELYLSAFPDSRMTADTPMVVNVELAGQNFMALNGGPLHVPNPSISFFVVCDTAAEVEHAWEKLSEGGGVLMALDTYPWSALYGWVQDRFGVSWQLSLGKLEEVGQKFSPLLMFANQQAGKAEEAIGFYTGIFAGSSVVGISRYDAGDGDIAGTVKHAQFKLGQQVFMAMDSSLPHLGSFSEGISLVITCETQEEIDYYWSRLTEGGREDRGGWLKDRYGVSWQVVPAVLGKLMGDAEKAPRVVQAFMQMTKFDIKQLMDA